MEELVNSRIKTEFLKKPIALWLTIVILLFGFGGGVYAGQHFLPEKIIIKGADSGDTAQAAEVLINDSTASSSQAGKLTNISDSPGYLKKDVNFNLYWATWNAIKNKSFNKEIPDTKLFYGSLQGLVASLGDPYSIFMTPVDATQFQDDLKGNFDGIGAEISVKNNQLIVVSPLDDSPAEKAGLKPKDFILKINGTSTEGMSSGQAVSLIRGKSGTEVKLTIYREGLSAAKEITIIRAPISVKSLSLKYVKQGTIAHIKVRQFNDDTMPLLDVAINEIITKPQVKSIVLDLRGNPGGYLDSAIAMAGEWSGDLVVVSERNRDGVETPHVAGKNPRLANYKTVVLADGGSASASEIVAGALKDWGKAKIVGLKTFGKGSVQDLTELPDGSEIKLTIAKWYTPNGANIDEQGIEPDYKVDLTEADYNKDLDPQMDKAIELLK